jgi:hypothetical protein
LDAGGPTFEVFLNRVLSRIILGTNRDEVTSRENYIS